MSNGQSLSYFCKEVDVKIAEGTLLPALTKQYERNLIAHKTGD